eukprot:COSAG06_NODE_1019_length_11057_cov_5.386293_2_plen_313_part_00
MKRRALFRNGRRVLNCAAQQALAHRSRTAATMVADAAATELLLRQLNHAAHTAAHTVADTAAKSDARSSREDAKQLAARFQQMLAGVSEAALVDHIGPCITAAEQRLATTGVERDSDAEAVQVASEALVAALDLRDAERVAVRRRWREIQAWSAPIPAATTTTASTADKAAAIAAIGGVGVGAGLQTVTEVEGSGEPTAEQVRERKQQEKKQALQLAKHVAPFQAAAVCLQARVRGWLVRSCGGNAPMPMDWHAFAAGEKCPPVCPNFLVKNDDILRQAQDKRKEHPQKRALLYTVCSADAVIALISRTFGA